MTGSSTTFFGFATVIVSKFGSCFVFVFVVFLVDFLTFLTGFSAAGAWASAAASSAGLGALTGFASLMSGISVHGV